MPTTSVAACLLTTGMGKSAAEEAELIERARRGDAEAFCDLAAQHYRSLYVLALKYSGNHHDAEDLLQDVMLNAYRGIGRFKGLSSFRTWLAKIMVNVFLNHKRRNDPLATARKRAVVADDFDPDLYFADRDRGSERSVHDRLLVQQIVEQLTSIPERQRIIFLMKHQQGMTCEEIAEAVGASVGTVKKTLFRVVDRLRQHFIIPVVKG